MPAVTFSPAAFKAAYPSFSTLNDTQLNQAFALATLYLSNRENSPVIDTDKRAILLNLLTAHIAAINYGENGEGSRQIVGRITSATQGSVSVSVSDSARVGSQSWYEQTNYGAQYWQATAPYRMARYRP